MCYIYNLNTFFYLQITYILDKNHHTLFVYYPLGTLSAFNVSIVALFFRVCSRFNQVHTNISMH